jgi:hypothetical protein
MSGISWKMDVGVNHVPAYQVSGRPFATGSLNATATATAVKVEFPYVTRWIYVINHDTNVLACGFSENGLAGTNKFCVHAEGASDKTAPASVRLELKVSEMWFTGSANFDVVAGLTSILPDRVSGSIGPSWSGSAGVG